MTRKPLGASVLAMCVAVSSSAHSQVSSADPTGQEIAKVEARTVAPLGMAYPVGYYEGYINWGGLDWWCIDIQRTYVAYGDEEGVSNIDFAGYGAMPCYHEWFGWQERPGDFYYSGPWQECLSEFGSDCPLYCNWYNYPNISGCQGTSFAPRVSVLTRNRGVTRRSAVRM